MLPLVRLGGNGPLEWPSGEAAGVLFRDALLGKILPPGIQEAGVQYCHIDPRTVESDLPVVETDISDVDGD